MSTKPDAALAERLLAAFAADRERLAGAVRSGHGKTRYLRCVLSDPELRRWQVEYDREEEQFTRFTRGEGATAMELPIPKNLR